VNNEILLKAGLVKQKDNHQFDFFYDGRAMIPIHDHNGKVLRFAGRTLNDATPKYLNTSESPVFKKHEILFGLEKAKKALRENGHLIVVEGYTDVMAMHQIGYHNTMATCGTALTDEHAKLIKRFAEEVVLLFDGDEAGQSAMLKAIDTLL